MRVVADTHVHLYDRVHPLAGALRRLAVGLQELAAGVGGEPVLAAFLVERRGEHVFERLAGGDAGLRPSEGLAVRACAEAGALRVEVQGARPFYLIAGRQVVTAERLELLSLASPASIPDGLSAGETVLAICAVGGLPVVSWAPGKWFFRRGRRVRALLERFVPAGLMAGDTLMRPRGWPEPAPFRLAKRLGGRVVCGSDALPFAGDAGSLARYGCVFDAAFDPAAPVTTLRCGLATAPVVTALGRRSGAVEFVHRRWGHQRAPVSG